MNPGTTSGRLIELLFDALDIKPNYRMIGIGASVDAMKSAVVVGWMKAGFKDASILDLESTMEINILMVTQEMIDKMHAKYPAHRLLMTIPAGLFNAVTEDQISFAYVVSDFVHKDVPDEVVEKILKRPTINVMSWSKALQTFAKADSRICTMLPLNMTCQCPFILPQPNFIRKL